MSQLKSIVLALLLLASTVGITVDNHYCHGSYIGTWFYVPDDACGMNIPKDGCGGCHDDVTYYSVHSEFQFVPSNLSVAPKLTAYTPAYVTEVSEVIENNHIPSQIWQADKSPPATPKVFLKVQSLLL